MFAISAVGVKYKLVLESLIVVTNITCQNKVILMWASEHMGIEGNTNAANESDGVIFGSTNTVLPHIRTNRKIAPIKHILYEFNVPARLNTISDSFEYNAASFRPTKQIC